MLPLYSVSLIYFYFYMHFVTGSERNLDWNTIFSIFSGKDVPFTVLGDNCCRLNSAGLIDMLQVELKDILFVSFKNKLFQTPFYVALDHETKSIVIGIRGSMSFNDFLVDMTGWPATIPGFPDSFKVSVWRRNMCYIILWYISFTIHCNCDSTIILSLLLSPNALLFIFIMTVVSCYLIRYT